MPVLVPKGRRCSVLDDGKWRDGVIAMGCRSDQVFVFVKIDGTRSPQIYHRDDVKLLPVKEVSN